MSDTITRRDLEHLRGLLSEIKTLESTQPKGRVVQIFYKDYRTGKGIPRSDSGDDAGREEEEEIKKRMDVLLRKRAKEILRLEDFLEGVDDPEMRTILRMYYRDGFSQEKIGEELGYHHTSISRRINSFLLENQNLHTIHKKSMR